MILSGADVVLPDRRARSAGTSSSRGRASSMSIAGRRGRRQRRCALWTCPDHYIVPGFIDVHVHGVEGHRHARRRRRDRGDGASASRALASPAFCPTSIACEPGALRRCLPASARRGRRAPPGGARVLPAHLESNFINPEYKGAQPLDCLRLRRARHAGGGRRTVRRWTGDDILEGDRRGTARRRHRHRRAGARRRARSDSRSRVARPSRLARSLRRDLRARRWQASRRRAAGDTSLQPDDARSAIGSPDSPARYSSHDDVTAELVCDGVHVHPAMMRVALAAKRPEQIMAITDGTAGVGPAARHADARSAAVRSPSATPPISKTARSRAASLTMDRAFAQADVAMGLSLVDAAMVCATTPARALDCRASA